MKDNEFKKHRRTAIAELRKVTPFEIKHGKDALQQQKISLSPADEMNGSPKPGDMIARNPKNHDDQWLVSYEYYIDNFEPIE